MVTNQSLSCNTYFNKKYFFACSIGRLYDDKLEIFRPKNQELALEDIAFVNYKVLKINNLNKFSAFLSVLCFLFGFVFLDKEISLYSLILGTCFILFSLFMKFERAYIQIVLKNPQQIVIRLEKKELKKGQIFVKKVNELKKMNTKK